MRLVTFAPQPGAAWRSGVRTSAGIVDLAAVHAASRVADWAPTPTAVMEHGLDGQATLQALVDRSGSVAGSVLDPSSVVVGPIFPAPSHHGYDPTDYYTIESRLGSLADFQDLVAAAHDLCGRRHGRARQLRRGRRPHCRPRPAR